MQAIDAESEEFLGVLLVEARKLLANAPKCVFEVAWNDRFLVLPDALHHSCEGVN